MISGRKLGAVAELDSDRRTGPDVDRCRQGIDTIGGPAAAAAARAQVGADGGVQNARRLIPGHAHVGLHVGVVREDFAIGIQGDVIGIAEADREDFPVFAIGIGGGDPTVRSQDAHGPAAGIPLARQEQIFVPVWRGAAFTAGLERDMPLTLAHASHPLRRIGLDFDWQSGVITGNEIDPPAVGRQSQGMRAVVTEALQIFELCHLVELIVAVGISQTVESTLATVRHVQGIEGPEQSLRPRKLDVEPLDASRFAAADRWRRDAIEAGIALVAGDDPTLGIDSQRDPGAEFVFRHGEQSLDLKAREQMECVAGRGRIGCRRSAGDHAHRDLGLLRQDVVIAAGGAGCRRPTARRRPTTSTRGQRQISSFSSKIEGESVWRRKVSGSSASLTTGGQARKKRGASPLVKSGSNRGRGLSAKASSRTP